MPINALFQPVFSVEKMAIFLVLSKKSRFSAAFVLVEVRRIERPTYRFKSRYFLGFLDFVSDSLAICDSK